MGSLPETYSDLKVSGTMRVIYVLLVHILLLAYFFLFVRIILNLLNLIHHLRL